MTLPGNFGRLPADKNTAVRHLNQNLFFSPGHFADIMIKTEIMIIRMAFLMDICTFQSFQSFRGIMHTHFLIRAGIGAVRKVNLRAVKRRIENTNKAHVFEGPQVMIVMLI